jgi:tRNA (cmo5U34)-methyltransferase
MDDPRSGWSEDDSTLFQELGSVFVPQRALQLRILSRLVPRLAGGGAVIDLCCGEGLLAEAVLESDPQAEVWGLDGSPAMLAAAERRLARFGGRWRGRPCDLRRFPDGDLPARVRAVVSSLAVHHLDDAEKAALFRRVFALLSPGGSVLLADLVRPASPQATALAADLWDETVREQAERLTPGKGAWERFVATRWNYFRYPDEVDKPSTLWDQLRWLAEAGFEGVDVFWSHAGHAVCGGFKPVSRPGGGRAGRSVDGR